MQHIAGHYISLIALINEYNGIIHFVVSTCIVLGNFPILVHSWQDDALGKSLANDSIGKND